MSTAPRMELETGTAAINDSQRECQDYEAGKKHRKSLTVGKANRTYINDSNIEHNRGKRLNQAHEREARRGHCVVAIKSPMTL